MTSAACHNDNELGQRLYEQRRAELLQRQFSNCEAYDRAVLTLSSALLGLSLAFVADMVPLSRATGVQLLIASWSVLGAAIVSTLISFRVSDAGIRQELTRANDYYLLRKEGSSGQSPVTRWIEWLNYLSGLFFVAGVGLTIAFAILNISEVQKMGDKSNNDGGSGVLEYGQGIPAMQEMVTIEGDLAKGQLIAPMQSIPQSQPITSQPASGSATPANPVPPPVPKG